MSELSGDKSKVQAAKSQSGGSSAGIILLQWLTYAFWGWTILSLVWLVFIVIMTFATKANMSEMVPYSIAATMVLLPLSLVCDLFYGRYEPAHKTGAAMVVMVIHAVIFALFGIGMLISGVLTIVQIAIGTTPEVHDSAVTWVWTALISTAIYGLVFLRTLNPLPKLHLKQIFPALMALIVGTFIVLGFVGPVAKASLTRDDREISSSLDAIVQGVEGYTVGRGELPKTLQDVPVPPRGKSLVDRNLVTYKPDGKASVKQSDGTAEEQHRYQLCVTYKEADEAGREEYDDFGEEGEYKSNVSTYGHPAGNVCYKLKYVIYN